MKVALERTSFENNADIINYVTKGLSPSNKNFEQLIAGLKTGQIKLADPNRNVIITNISTTDLELIYKNKKDNELKAFIIMILGAILSFKYGYKSGKLRSKVKDNTKITLF